MGVLKIELDFVTPKMSSMPFIVIILGYTNRISIFCSTGKQMSPKFVLAIRCQRHITVRMRSCININAFKLNLTINI